MPEGAGEKVLLSELRFYPKLAFRERTPSRKGLGLGVGVWGGGGGEERIDRNIEYEVSSLVISPWLRS